MSTSMRRRPSSRLLILDGAERLLLFRFVHKSGSCAGQDFWATPGGGLEEDETFEQAAIRELREETGIRIQSVGHSIARKEFPLQLADGETVIAEEQFFRIDVTDNKLSMEEWTDLEKEVMTDHKWWSKDELQNTTETVFPEDILAILSETETVKGQSLA